MRLRSYLNDYGWPGPACRGLGGTKDTLAVDLLPWPRQHLDVVYAGEPLPASVESRGSRSLGGWDIIACLPTCR